MIIKIKVKTNCREQYIKKINEEYKICLKSKPVKGKANDELLKLLKKHFGTNAKIISGKSSPKKVVKLN